MSGGVDILWCACDPFETEQRVLDYASKMEREAECVVEKQETRKGNSVSWTAVAKNNRDELDLKKNEGLGTTYVWLVAWKIIRGRGGSSEKSRSHPRDPRENFKG
jgi:hypothetical protein